MRIRLAMATLLVPLLLPSLQANEKVPNSAEFLAWIYPDAYHLQMGITGEAASGQPIGETAQITTEDTMQRVVRYYAGKAGLDPSGRPIELTLPDGNPALDAAMVGIRRHDDAPSAMLLRNAGENAAAVTILYWTSGGNQKMAISITRSKDDSRTLVQLALHRLN